MAEDKKEKNAKRAKTPAKSLWRLLSYTFSHYKLAGVVMAVCVLFSATGSALGAALFAPIITELMNPEGVDFSLIVTYIIIIACIYAISALAAYAYNRIMMYIAQGTLRNLRCEMFSKMQSFPLKYFDERTHGDIMSLYTNDVDTMRQLLSQTIPQLLSSLITVIALFVLMLLYSVTLMLVVFVMLAVIGILVWAIGGRSSKGFRSQQKSLAKLNGYVEEMTEGQKVVKVFCHEKEAKCDFEKINDEMNSSSRYANTYSFILGPINNNIGYIQYILVAVVGIVLAIAGYNTGDDYIGLLSVYVSVWNDGGSIAVCAGMIISFLAYSRQFNNPIQQVSQQFSAIVMGLAGAERIFDMLDTEPERDEGEVTLTYGEKEEGKFAWKRMENGESHYIDVKGDIRFDDVSFGYESDYMVLKHITLYALPGEKVAFVGSTGAGKTTVTNLINRFYDIQSGKITYDGIDVRDIRKDDLRRSLGIVLQDTHLFTGTIMENIRYGRPDATDEECVEAARLANADGFISHLPQGYDTVISGDASEISQGQAQLLAISRAMVTKCPVLILDEATSSIDTRTEKLIESGMDRLMEGRTVFMIAHRLSTVRHSGVIMVLDHGEIIERGTHEQLMEKKGAYYGLCTGAFELD